MKEKEKRRGDRRGREERGGRREEGGERREAKYSNNTQHIGAVFSRYCTVHLTCEEVGVVVGVGTVAVTETMEGLVVVLAGVCCFF